MKNKPARRKYLTYIRPWAHRAAKKYPAVQVFLKDPAGWGEFVVMLIAKACKGEDVGSGTDMKTGERDLEYRFPHRKAAQNFKEMCETLKRCRCKLIVEE